MKEYGLLNCKISSVSNGKGADDILVDGLTVRDVVRMPLRKIEGRGFLWGEIHSFTIVEDLPNKKFNADNHAYFFTMLRDAYNELTK